MIRNIRSFRNELLIVLLFLAVRLAALWTGRLPVDSDEAIFGIMGLEILQGHFPVFFHGQDYLGSFQAWLSVPFQLLFGPTPLALRMLAIFEGLTALFLWRWIFRQWGLKNSWLFFGLLFALPPEFLLSWTMKSRVQVETLFLGSLWTAGWVSLVSPGRGVETRLRPWLLFGLLSGLCWWTSPLTALFGMPAVGASLWDGHLRATLFQGLRRFFRSLADHPGSRILSMLFLLSGGLLILRPGFGSESFMGILLFKLRWPLTAFFFGTLIGLLFFWKRNAPIQRLLAFGLGLMVGQLPTMLALFHTTGHSHRLGLQPVEKILLNIPWLFFLTSGGLIGIQDEFLQPIGLPIGIVFSVVTLYLLFSAFLVLHFFQAGQGKESIPLGVKMAVLGVLLSVIFLCLTQESLDTANRYAVPLMLMLLILLGWFFSRLWRISRSFTGVALGLLLAVHLFSILQIQTDAVSFPGGVPRTDEKMLAFLQEQAIASAVTSLNSVQHGYWDAYRLSWFSGERVIFHPVFHMPRIERYRQHVQQADRLAIVTRDPDPVQNAFTQHSIAFSEKNVGPYWIVYDFDKGKVDALDLIAYEASILELDEMCRTP